MIDVIDTIRPFLINDGGNIEFVKYEDGIVYIEMQGACAECISLDYTRCHLDVTPTFLEFKYKKLWKREAFYSFLK